MTDIRQSPQFANFMKDLGWQYDKIGKSFVYLRKFPVFGYFAKIPRPSEQFTEKDFDLLKNKYHIFKLNISPFMNTSYNGYNHYKNYLFKSGFKINHSPFNPTTTIQIDLTRKREEIFNSFSEAKRRAVRRALKNNIIIKDTGDINSFIEIRKKQYSPAGFLITREMEMLWKNFYPKNASLLLSYSNNKPLAGILMLYFDKIAYYWYASALKKGKKLFAPTLLVWEALKLAKKKGCKILDFEGIYDERFPKASESWRGFTKFKEGFGGKKVVFMENFSK